MLKKLLQIGSLLILTISVLGINSNQNERLEPYNTDIQFEDRWIDVPVSYALDVLGDERPNHYLMNIDDDSAKWGEELVRYGQLKDGSNKRISKYFLCTDCHNQVLETDDPADESPERVLDYSMKNDIPFLPASTFYGMYNKEHWYNGDYDKKYGDLVRDTRDTLFNAIQLCATQCSQGREMEDWEIRCVIHYYKSIELKVSDLNFTEKEYGLYVAYISSLNKKAKELIKSKYNQINDAHFGTSKIPEIEGYQPNYKNGEFIYVNGCLHCHAPERGITNFDLDTTQLTLKFLHNKKDKYNSYSISHITRYGTYAIGGRRQYMPQYSYENMSDEQMLDLMHYIKVKANQ